MRWRCDGKDCGGYITGTMFHCKVCDDFDLCFGCQKTKNWPPRHEESHLMMKSSTLTTSERLTASSDHPDDSIVTAIDITLDGKFVLTGSSVGTFSLANVDGRVVVQKTGKTEDGVGIRFVCILSDQSRYVFVDEANRVELRDFSNQEAEILDQPDVKVISITTHGVEYVLLGCESGELLLFNLCVKQNKYKHQAHSEAVSQVKSNSAGVIHFFVSGSTSGCVKLWHVSKTEPPLWSQIWSHDNVYSHSITALAFVPYSADVLLGSFDNKVHRINAAGIVRTYKFKGYAIAALRVVEDSLVGAGSTYDVNGLHCRVVVKWSLFEALETGMFLQEKDVKYSEEEEKAEEDEGIQVKPVNNASGHVAMIGNGYFTIMNFKTGTSLCTFRDPRPSDHHFIRALAFVPGGEFVLLAWRYDTTLKLLDLRNGQIVEEFHFEQEVRSIACASNGLVCVGLYDGQVCFLSFNNLPSHSGQLEE